MILVDKISALTLKDNSTFTGAINPDGQAGTVKLMLESGSTRNLTADAYLTEFNGSTENIAANGHHVYVNGTQLIRQRKRPHGLFLCTKKEEAVASSFLFIFRLCRCSPTHEPSYEKPFL